LDTISGTASDGISGSGVEKVEINIKLQNHLFWDSYDWINTPTWLAVNGINDWTYDSSEVPWQSDNIYQIKSRATDNATNIEVPDTMIEVFIDMDSPTTMINTPIDNKWLNNLDNISGGATDISGAGIDYVEVSILKVKSNSTWDGSQWTTGEYWLHASETEQWYYNTSNVPWKTGDQYMIQARATDNANNIEIPGQSVTFWFDDTQPDYLEIAINNNDEYTTELEATLLLEAYDMGSGVSHMSFSFYGSKDSWSAWEPFNKTKKLMLTLNDEEKSIYFRVKDHAENVAEPKYDKIILDRTTPEKLSIVINDDAEYTNSGFVTLALDAFDETSGLDLMAFSFDAESWENEEEFEDSKTVKVPPGDGSKIIYFKVTDKAGNTADFVNDSIILDSTAPQALSMEIVNSSKGSDSISIELKLTAMDFLSGVNSMSFSFDNKTWSSWEAFTQKKTFFLTDNERTIYYRVSDVVGNVATPTSLVIPQINDQAKEKNNEKIENTPQNITIAVITFIVILIIIIVITTQIISKRRKKRAEQKVLATKPITRKPNGFNTVTSFQKFNGIPQPVIGNMNVNMVQKPILNQLPVTSTTNTPTLGVVPTIPATQTPIATMPAQATTPKPMPWVPMKPQLPPAKENTS